MNLLGNRILLRGVPIPLGVYMDDNQPFVKGPRFSGAQAGPHAPKNLVLAVGCCHNSTFVLCFAQLLNLIATPFPYQERLRDGPNDVAATTGMAGTVPNPAALRGPGDEGRGTGLAESGRTHCAPSSILWGRGFALVGGGCTCRTLPSTSGPAPTTGLVSWWAVPAWPALWSRPRGSRWKP